MIRVTSANETIFYDSGRGAGIVRQRPQIQTDQTKAIRQNNNQRESIKNTNAKKGGKINVFHCLTQMKVTEMAFTGKCKLDKCAYEEMCAN